MYSYSKVTLHIVYIKRGGPFKYNKFFLPGSRVFINKAEEQQYYVVQLHKGCVRFKISVVVTGYGWIHVTDGSLRLYSDRLVSDGSLIASLGNNGQDL